MRVTRKIKLFTILSFLLLIVIVIIGRNKNNELTTTEITKNTTITTSKKITTTVQSTNVKNDKITTVKEKTEKIAILTFHRIVTDEVKKIQFPNSQWVESVDMFEKQMKYLYDNGYKTLSLDEFYDWYIGKIEYDKKTVVIAVDDGNADDYYLVMPILKKYNLKGTSFVIGSRTNDTETSKYDPKVKTYISKSLINKTKKEYPNFVYQSHSWKLHEKDSTGRIRILGRI